jgi:hypothetical protein
MAVTRSFFGATVTYVNSKGEERTVTIKGIDEVDNLAGEVSWVAPIARALLKSREGDEVSLMTPGGVETLEILSVTLSGANWAVALGRAFAMKLMQCWDDGVTTDVRLVSLLRRHGARATFNLNAGLHGRQRSAGLASPGHRGLAAGPWRTSRGLRRFQHCQPHAHAPAPGATPHGSDEKHEISVGRSRLQDAVRPAREWLRLPVWLLRRRCRMQAVREAGHLLRPHHLRAAHAGVETDRTPWPLQRRAATSSAPDFWQSGWIVPARLASFWFWGHSYELVGEAMWAAFDASVARPCGPSLAFNGATRATFSMETTSERHRDLAPAGCAAGGPREPLRAWYASG